MFWRLGFLFTWLSFCFLTATSASALEFRKCTYKIMVSALDQPTFEYREARMTVWVRTKTAKESNRGISKIASKCVRNNVLRDQEILGDCGGNSKQTTLLGDSTKQGWGVSGFRLTRGFKRLRAEVCKRYRQPSNGLRTITDVRKFDGFTISLQKHSGNGSCPIRYALPKGLLTLECNNQSKALEQADGFNYHWYYHSSILR